MHAAVEGGPGYSSRVLALQEEGFGLAILEAEDFAVATDVQFTLEKRVSVVDLEREVIACGVTHLQIRTLPG